jgi:hypothetical protein
MRKSIFRPLLSSTLRFGSLRLAPSQFSLRATLRAQPHGGAIGLPVLLNSDSGVHDNRRRQCAGAGRIHCRGWSP